ncbi:DUF5686 and carboxypeptidase-like regulatory domain-containing protein [Mucilaginibacter sp. BT774]|uniref:DUF5686 and carboxypeptidase-like regulatory domain-containing protein n=1 Tax=Mucilaginibacter sp. BT774 TaxID=3062276 RepID=UPI002674854C|nr:DUF5686 and carboxypeptidase-like regulatory domain-containing protein [Mucilaginibacter sp. BT774]MDO3627735.1 DUF5686 family protein [Mucilaginibacter sp. BT774]
MKTNYTYNIIKSTLLLLFVVLSTALMAQQTIVKGVVTDARTHETMPGVSVSFDGTTIGNSTDVQGNYRIIIDGNYSRIKISFIGYKTLYKDITPGTTQTINIVLAEDRKTLNEVVIRGGKKTRYTNKNNPAVELIRKVIAHKDQNRIENYNYAEFQQYERVLFSLSDLSEKFKNKRIFKNYQFLFTEQDSDAIGGKNLLPIYLEEKLSDNYYRKSPYVKKQVIEANKQVKYDENFIDNDGLKTYFNRLYMDIEIYDNNIPLLGNQLLSPIADGAPAFYKFFITDTIKDVSPQLIELSFTPRNTNNMLFEGKIYITMDDNYAVQKAELTVNKNVNLNFVRKMQTTLAYTKTETGRYRLSQSDLKIDFGINKNKGGGVYGERIVLINNFAVNKPRPESTYTGPAQMIAFDAKEKGDEFWKANRPDTLKQSQLDIYKNIDSLQTIPSFRRTMDLVTLFVAGYKNEGPFEIGPTNTFYGGNAVEGFRARLGGRTTTALSKRYYFETYGAYGFRDDKFKYFLSGTYSLNNKSIYSFPQEYIRASFQHDTKIPGTELGFVQEDNFLLSIKRGESDLLTYNDQFKIDYVHEYLNHFSYKVEFRSWNQASGGALVFQNTENNLSHIINNLQTTDLSLELRYAPHEKFYQGKLYRTPIPDKYPIFTLRFDQGIKGLLKGQYNYQSMTANITKRFYLSQLGFTDVEAEGGYIFNKLPFPLLDIHHANQSYALQLESYNLMNYLEFVSDHYASINIDHHFNGLFFNRIPLLDNLKLREVVSFKSLWGGLRSENNPVNDPSLFQFPMREGGQLITHSLNNGPYMEASAGIENIFKLVRLDLVRRLSYLDNVDAPKWGIRARVKFQF